MGRINFSVIKITLGAIFLFLSCNLQEDGEKLLSSFTTSKGAKVEIYYVDMGATTKQTIQVRSSLVFINKGVLANFDHNYLEESKLLNDSMLLLILKDSGSVAQDSLVFNIAAAIRQKNSSGN
jgi:hypothetical protein